MEESNKFDLSSLMCYESFESNVDDVSTLSSDHKNLHCLSYENIESQNLLDFFVLSDEIVLRLVKKENEHLPRDDYLERLRGGDINMIFGDLNLNMNKNLIDIRNEALEMLWKATAYYGFGICCLSLAVNYLDRFLSVYNFERGHDWSMQLLALACLSIAAKMEESQVLPKFEDIGLGESKFVCETKGMHKMELLVLDHLNWKMQSSTPCSFVDHFLRKITSEQHHLSEISMMDSLDLFFDITKWIDFLEFRPSEIAAAAAIFVSKELETNEIDDVLTRFVVVEKDKTLKCLELMKMIAWVEVSAELSSNNLATVVPESPDGVIDVACLSYESDENETTTAGSEAISSLESSNISKRHKSFHDDKFF